MKTTNDFPRYAAIFHSGWLLAAVSGLLLSACDNQNEATVDPPDVQDVELPAPAIVPVSPDVKPPIANAPKVKKREQVEEKPAEGLDESREFIYVDENSGEELKFPLEFREYPEWGLYRYADQVIRHNNEQMKLNAGDPAQVEKFRNQVNEFTAKKSEAYEAMERRLAGAAAE